MVEQASVIYYGRPYTPYIEEGFPKRFQYEDGMEKTISGQQFDDLTLGEIKRAARDARLKAESEHRSATERFEATLDALADAQHYEASVADIIHGLASMQNGGPARTRIAGDNLKEVLIINFADSDGFIKGIDATTGLVENGYYSNRETADGAVYTTLGKEPFEKVVRGVYRISTVHVDWIRLRESNGHRPPRQLAPSEQSEFNIVANVARKQGGQIRYSQTKSVLAESGHFSSESSVNFALRRVLIHSERFQKVERGLYRLIDHQRGG